LKLKFDVFGCCTFAAFSSALFSAALIILSVIGVVAVVVGLAVDIGVDDVVLLSSDSG
jgi:hypothetical protein